VSKLSWEVSSSTAIFLARPTVIFKLESHSDMGSIDPAQMEWQSLTPDKGVTKKVLHVAEGEVAGPNAKVTLRYSLSLPGAADSFDSSAGRKDGSISLRLGKRKAIRGLEILAASMSAGEHALGRILPAYAYGAAGLPRCGVPPDSGIDVDVEILRVEQQEKAKGIADMNSKERFEEATKCKERGNALFKEAKVERAAAEYQKCLRYVEYIFYRPRKAESSLNSQQNEGVANTHQDGHTQTVESPTEGGDDEQAGSTQNDSEQESDVQVVDLTGGTVRGALDSGLDAVDDNGFVAADVHEEVAEGEDSGSAQSHEASKTANIHGAEGREKTGPVSEPASGEDLAQVSSNLSDRSGVSISNEGQTGEALGGEDEDPDEADVRELHVAALNNMSLCLLKLGDNKKAEQVSSVSVSLDPENHKPLYYRFVGDALAMLTSLLSSLTFPH
jgi:tetratricopeptide (TPR) repeat protein